MSRASTLRAGTLALAAGALLCTTATATLAAGFDPRRDTAYPVRASQVKTFPAPQATKTWPPRPKSGLFFMHIGEEHLTDDDGAIIFPRTIAAARAWKPDALLSSADKSDNGTVEKLTDYRTVMDDLAKDGIPWFGATGNHDRETPGGISGAGGISPLLPFDPYKQVFAPMPYPFGDGAPVADSRFAPRTRPPEDPEGASTHYWLDVGNVRIIVIDNSCQSITNCAGSLVSPSFPHDGVNDQYAFLRKFGGEAEAAGKQVWVVMHIPTRDPRDQTTAAFVSLNHQMGKGLTPDNLIFEQVAQEVGVDAIFLGHIKGLWEYRGQGGIPYFIDGGAGGELYTTGPVGVDTGYWHGYRLINVEGSRVRYDVVPLLDSIEVKGPDRVAFAELARFEGFGKQPPVVGPKVPALELRDPDRSVSDGAALPNVARIWTTANPRVLRPVAARVEDDRRDPATQTVSGNFQAQCPGRVYVSITSGFTTQGKVVTVPSRPGPIVTSISRGRSVISRRGSRRVATVKLAQPAQIDARLKRGRRVVRQLRNDCQLSRSAPVTVSGRGLKAGRYTLELRVRSDRRTELVRRSVTVR